MKSFNSHMPKQTRSLDRQQKNEVMMRGAGSAADGVKASGWLDILGKAARGAAGAIL
ncbi:MAG: hypothetical protein ACI8WB_000063 [Phenylobacterium sp.]|jgi:hypothetical protein